MLLVFHPFLPLSQSSHSVFSEEDLNCLSPSTNQEVYSTSVRSSQFTRIHTHRVLKNLDDI